MLSYRLGTYSEKPVQCLYNFRVFILFLNNSWPGVQGAAHNFPISAFEGASGACIFTYFSILFYMHNSIIMCQRDNHPDSTKIYKKIQRTCTPRCLKQPCGRIELVHVKQVNPEYKKTHKNYSEKQYKTHKDQIIPTWNRCKIVVELTSFLGSTAPGKIAF